MKNFLFMLLILLIVIKANAQESDSLWYAGQIGEEYLLYHDNENIRIPLIRATEKNIYNIINIQNDEKKWILEYRTITQKRNKKNEKRYRVVKVLMYGTIGLLFGSIVSIATGNNPNGLTIAGGTTATGMMILSLLPRGETIRIQTFLRTKDGAKQMKDFVNNLE